MEGLIAWISLASIAHLPELFMTLDSFGALSVSQVLPMISLLSFLKIIYVYFCLHWVFIVMLSFSLAVASGGSALLRCAGFLIQCLLLLQSMVSRSQASVVGACRL